MSASVRMIRSEVRDAGGVAEWIREVMRSPLVWRARWIDWVWWVLVLCPWIVVPAIFYFPEPFGIAFVVALAGCAALARWVRSLAWMWWIVVPALYVGLPAVLAGIDPFGAAFLGLSGCAIVYPPAAILVLLLHSWHFTAQMAKKQMREEIAATPDRSAIGRAFTVMVARVLAPLPVPHVAAPVGLWLARDEFGKSDLESVWMVAAFWYMVPLALIFVADASVRILRGANMIACNVGVVLMLMVAGGCGIMLLILPRELSWVPLVAAAVLAAMVPMHIRRVRRVFFRGEGA